MGWRWDWSVKGGWQLGLLVMAGDGTYVLDDGGEGCERCCFVMRGKVINANVKRCRSRNGAVP
jgi:hypothetical protein